MHELGSLRAKASNLGEFLRPKLLKIKIVIIVFIFTNILLYPACYAQKMVIDSTIWNKDTTIYCANCESENYANTNNTSNTNLSSSNQSLQTNTTKNSDQMIEISEHLHDLVVYKKRGIFCLTLSGNILFYPSKTNSDKEKNLVATLSFPVKSGYLTIVENYLILVCAPENSIPNSNTILNSNTVANNNLTGVIQIYSLYSFPKTSLHFTAEVPWWPTVAPTVAEVHNNRQVVFFAASYNDKASIEEWELSKNGAFINTKSWSVKGAKKIITLQAIDSHTKGIADALYLTDEKGALYRTEFAKDPDLLWPSGITSKPEVILVSPKSRDFSKFTVLFISDDGFYALPLPDKPEDKLNRDAITLIAKGNYSQFFVRNKSIFLFKKNNLSTNNIAHNVAHNIANSVAQCLYDETKSENVIVSLNPFCQPKFQAVKNSDTNSLQSFRRKL